MVYSSVLRRVGNQFMTKYLRYDPGEGIGRQPPLQGGGMYIGAHLRRKDFLYSHKETVPTLRGVVSQLNVLLHEQNMTMVFVASDASNEGDECMLNDC